MGSLKPLHSRPLHEIKAPDVLKVLRGLEANNMREAAHRAAQWTAAVYRFAIQSGYCTTNPRLIYAARSSPRLSRVTPALSTSNVRAPHARD